MSSQPFPRFPVSLWQLRTFEDRKALWPHWLEPLVANRLKETDALLRDIQANSLKAHGRKFTRLLMLRFGGTPAQSLAFLRAWEASPLFTSMHRQLSDITDYKIAHRLFADPKWKNAPVRDPVAAAGAAGISTLSISGAGITKLNLTAAQKPPANENQFAGGMDMPNSLASLGDDPAEWTPDFYLATPPDALVLLAHDDAGPAGLGALDDAVAKLGAPFGVSIKKREEGVKELLAGEKLEREPFGFIDGLSNLVFLQDDIDAQGSHAVWSGSSSLERVLINNDHAPLLRGCSFLVFRKLEQDAALFRDFVSTRGPAAAHKLVGRTRDGAPLTAPGAPDKNDFNYAADPGTRCPFHAHIRKANPRKDELRGALFVRRSAVYTRGGDPAAPDTTSGLLFLGYMSSINEQFFKMQSMWLSDPGSPEILGTVGRDPLLFGTHTRAGRAPARLVTPRGGGYFFVPTRTWLRSL